ncbi:MAG TPA: lipopolysaccharide assembly protein LapB [Usitatibacteraceae bacterium]|nr:lipopolysaccharide assembly protein LapB [Usitatibacteraceae bacterium]
MAEWLPWLLVGALVCFGLGWLAARIDIQQLLAESRAMPRAYFRGLNFLLAEQPDKAIDAFIEVTKAHPEAVELQFALGSLFRRRGEVDRAIRVHQELAERGGLSADSRTEARIELARDHQKAGLLDHAERILEELAGGSGLTPAQRREVLLLLKDICVQAREWRHAVDAALRLRGEFPELDAQSIDRDIANYHCELAVDARRKGAAEAARHLDDALAANSRCVRANQLKGEWCAADGDHAAAIAAFRAIEAQDPSYLGLVAQPMLASFAALGKTDDGIEWLKARASQGLNVMEAVFRSTLGTRGADAARAVALDHLMQHPTLVGLDRLFEAGLLSASDEARPELKALKDVVHTHAARLAVYLCRECGFKSRQYHWQCPACSAWESFPPQLTAEYETADRHLFAAHTQSAMPPQANP